MLRGSEVKSLRGGKAQMTDAYAVVDDGEVWLRNLHIPPYAPASSENHEPERPRKLLLHRAEIERLVGTTLAEGADPDPRPHLLQGLAGQGRAGPGPRQGGARSPPRDRRPRRPPRSRARVQGADEVTDRGWSRTSAERETAGGLHEPPHVKGFRDMRTRLLLLPCVAALASLALVVPAQAQADSFPNKAGNYVSDHVEYFVAGLVAAILLLLLVVSITQRRSKEKEKKAGTVAGASPPPVARPPLRAEIAATAQTAEPPPGRRRRRRSPPVARRTAREAPRRNGGRPASSSARPAWSTASAARKRRSAARRRRTPQRGPAPWRRRRQAAAEGGGEGGAPARRGPSRARARAAAAWGSACRGRSAAAGSPRRNRGSLSRFLPSRPYLRSRDRRLRRAGPPVVPVPVPVPPPAAGAVPQAPADYDPAAAEQRVRAKVEEIQREEERIRAEADRRIQEAERLQREAEDRTARAQASEVTQSMAAVPPPAQTNRLPRRPRRSRRPPRPSLQPRTCTPPSSALQEQRQAQDRSMEEAQERLRQIEERTKAAERRAAEAERLAQLKSEQSRARAATARDAGKRRPG